MEKTLETLLEGILSFLEKEVYPNEIRWLNQDLKASFAELDKLRGAVQQKGLWAPHLAVKDGGLGLPLRDFGLVSELLGTSPFGHYLFNCQAPDIGNMELLHQFASPELQDRWLKPLMAGDIRSCFSMTEPEFAGSNPVMMATTAKRERDEYVINGHKWFTSSADGAAFAVVMAVTDPDNPNPYQRASMILVPTDTPGFQLVRNIPIMGEAGYGYISHAEIRYENCRVPVSHLIGKEGQGFVLAQERLGPGRIHHCMRWIGIAERAFSLMCQRAVSRALSPSRSLADMQSIQNWIAESRAEITASRLMVLDTARQIEEKGAKAAKESISTIKFYVAGVLQRVLDRAIQTHGALGITEDTVLSFWFRHERGARIYDGPDEVHKSVLARHILKQYGYQEKK
jgi:alkylation response protein AidB-like acyl-CoA dehydrogenase